MAQNSLESRIKAMDLWFVFAIVGFLLWLSLPVRMLAGIDIGNADEGWFVLLAIYMFFIMYLARKKFPRNTQIVKWYFFLMPLALGYFIPFYLKHRPNGLRM